MSVRLVTPLAGGGEGPAAAEPAQVMRALTQGGVALLANSAVTALFGVLYWLLAARLLTSAAVGRGSGLVAALLTVSGFCQLNYARSLSGLIPAAARPRRLLAAVYGRTVALSFVVGSVAALLLPQVAGNFAFLRGNLFFFLAFTSSVALWTIFSLEDGALTSVRRATVVPFENGIYGLLKLACLAVFWWLGYRTATALLASWVLPLVGVIIPVNLLLFRRALPEAHASAGRPATSSATWVRYDFAGYLFSLAGTLPLPVLVLAWAGPTGSARFYVPFTIATAIDLLSLNLGNSLTAELARTGGAITAATRRYMVRAWTAVGLVSLLLFAVAPQVLDLFGERYRLGGALILRLLMLASLPRSVLFLGIAVQRARHQGRSILWLQATAAVGILGLALVLGGSGGGSGAALAWLIASAVAGVLAVRLLVRGRPLSRLTVVPLARQTPEPIELP